jgi:hypothetical protein
VVDDAIVQPECPSQGVFGSDRSPVGQFDPVALLVKYGVGEVRHIGRVLILVVQRFARRCGDAVTSDVVGRVPENAAAAILPSARPDAGPIVEDREKFDLDARAARLVQARPQPGRVVTRL